MKKHQMNPKWGVLCLKKKKKEGVGRVRRRG